MSSSIEYKCPAGALRQRIELQSAVEMRDAIGGVVRAWSTVATVWGEIKPITAREVVANSQVQGRVTHFVRVRYYSALRQSWRLKYGSRVFNISGIRDADERKKIMVVDAVEAV